LPLAYHYERTFGGVNLWVYFWPQQAYLFNVTGNFFQQTVSLNTDLQGTYTLANLGVPSNTTAFTLNSGQLVINNVDMEGTYADMTAFITAVNAAEIPCVPNFGSIGITPTTPFIQASMVGVNFILTNTGNLAYGSAAYTVIQTNGVQSGTNITFQNFSTVNGPYQYAWFCTSYDAFYTNYLEYELAERICQKNNYVVPDGVARQLNRYRLQINKLAEPLDLMAQKVSVLAGSKAINYAAINIGQGWTVSNY
jgi:hypothetical protein